MLQTKNIVTEVPNSCKVFIVRGMAPKELEKDLLRGHPSANYGQTKDYILEQVNLKKDAYCYDKSNATPMEVDPLLAKIQALKGDVRRNPSRDYS